MNEPRSPKVFPKGRYEGHEGKKEEESFWCCYGYLLKIGMLPLIQGLKPPVSRVKNMDDRKNFCFDKF
jgi:hypothetical protein